jgi:3,4-dihydroxy 2-butanone 4-phosphate synthase/GTP cyclohydrolase II
MDTPFQFNTISEAISDISNGKMILVVDDEDRENEGDLVMAAQFATPEAINFMIKYGKGLVCLPATDEILDRLNINEMVTRNRDSYQTAFTVSIDGAKKHGIGTGISPADRSRTIQLVINPHSTADDIVSPGHIFPLRAQEMGVLKRAGHTEAAVDLAKLAGLSPAGVICEVINDNGEMARVPDLIEFAQKHSLKMITIKDLIQYRVQQERFVIRVESTQLPTEFGNFELICYQDILNHKEHIALVKGNINTGDPVLTRVHSECLTGDIFGSQRCDCGPQLHAAMQMIEAKGAGLILYMRQEGRGIGLINKLKAYNLQSQGVDTVDANLQLGFAADLRDYGVGAQMLLDLGVTQLDLITNNPTKIIGLEGYGLKINKRVSLVVPTNPHNEKYMQAKVAKMGHIL